MEPNNLNQNDQNTNPAPETPASFIPPQPQPTPSPQMSAPGAAAGSGFGKIALVAIALLILGGGAFLFLGKNSSNINEENNGITMTQNTNKSLSCRELLPDADFERIVGKSASNYDLVEEDNNLAQGEGLSTQALEQEFGDLEFQSGSRQLVCGYVSPAMPIKTAIAGEIVITITSDGGDMTQGFNRLKNPAAGVPGGEVVVGGQTWKLSADGTKMTSADGKIVLPIERPTDLSGIGASAFEQRGGVYVLSSDRKNIILVSAFKPPVDTTQLKEIAKVVDLNLSR